MRHAAGAGSAARRPHKTAPHARGGQQGTMKTQGKSVLVTDVGEKHLQAKGIKDFSPWRPRWEPHATSFYRSVKGGQQKTRWRQVWMGRSAQQNRETRFCV